MVCDGTVTHHLRRRFPPDSAPSLPGTTYLQAFQGRKRANARPGRDDASWSLREPRTGLCRASPRGQFCQQRV
jgi:hypothetical protein